MANYKGHIAGGLVAAGLYGTALSMLPVAQVTEAAGVLQNWQAWLAIGVISLLFSLFPDVDTNSKAQDIFFGIAFPLDVLLLWQGYLQAAAYLGLIAMLPIIGHHRGWTHKKWSMLVIPLPVLLVPYLYNGALQISLIYYGAAVAGYFSHLLLDGLIIRRFRVRN